MGLIICILAIFPICAAIDFYNKCRDNYYEWKRQQYIDDLHAKGLKTFEESYEEIYGKPLYTYKK